MQGVSRAFEGAVDVAAGLMDSEVRLAILACVATSDILVLDAPPQLLTRAADSPAVISK